MTIVKPYGDTLGDGKVQLSFTLPLEWSEAADEAARRLAVKMGFSEVAVADGRSIGRGFSFFVIYASTPHVPTQVAAFIAARMVDKASA